MEPLLLLANGDATDYRTHGGLPFSLLTAFQQMGRRVRGVQLDPRRLRLARRLWNFRQLLTTTRPGGYQYSEDYLRSLLAQAALDSTQSLHLLSIYPHLPAFPWPKAWRVSFYIDATTHQILHQYGGGRLIAPGFQRHVHEQERLGYQAAEVLVCRCQWAADSLIADYGIDPARVHVVPGGANLDEAALAAQSPAPPPPSPGPKQPLRLGFLGKEWVRKGGPFLLQLAEALQQRGVPTVIRAIGPDPPSLPSHPCLQPLGFIDKRREFEHFLAEVHSWHFGTLFSTAEAFGISNRECLRLGVPVLSHEVGGIASTIPDAGCGQLFPPNPEPAEVANWVVKRLCPYEGYLTWRGALASRADSFGWPAAVRVLQRWI